MSSIVRFQEKGSQQSPLPPRPPKHLRGKRRSGRRERPMSVSRIITESHEPKNLDLASNFTASTTTGTLQCLNLILQGSSGNNRTGRQVRLDHLRLHMTFQEASATQSDAYRLLIILDKESRGANPAVGDVLTNTTFGTPALLSSHNFDNVPTRFTILHDEVIITMPTVSVSSTNAAWNQILYNRLIHVPLNKVTHYYNTSAGTIADIDSGALFFLVYGVQTSNAGGIYFDSRLVFRDM